MSRTAREIKKLHRKRERRLKERSRRPQQTEAELKIKEEEKPSSRRAPRRKKEKVVVSKDDSRS